MVKPSWVKYDDRYLLARLKSTSRLMHEVGDPHVPYDLLEWAGVDRGTTYRQLAAECDTMIAELASRGVSWYEAYWGEPRPADR